ncbi:redoxin domain-containing protein [bacterium]|nr:redoxin domain-containing protein [bacterium]
MKIPQDYLEKHFSKENIMQKNLLYILWSLLVLTCSEAISGEEVAVVSDSIASLYTNDNYTECIGDHITINLLAVSNPVWQTRWQREKKVEATDGNKRNKPEYWWRPDGQRLKKVPFRRRFRTFGSFHFDFLVKIKGIEDYSIFAGHRDPNELAQVKIQPAVGKNRKPIPNLFIISVRGFPTHGRIETCTLSIGLAYGPWTLVQGWGGLNWSEQRDVVLDSSCGALIEIPSQIDNNIHVDLAHRLVHEEVRLVATDQQDRVHVATLKNRGEGDGIVRRQCIFNNLSLEQLRTISVEKRDYQYAQFPDVVLEPNHVLAWTSYSAIKKQKGQDAPEFRQIREWGNGGPYNIMDLRGKVVLLDFWNYRCGGCLYEMPKLMELHDQFADKGLIVIGVHADMVDSFEELEQELAKSKTKLWKGREIPFPIALDGGGKTQIKGTNYSNFGATTAAYGVQNFPTKILINKDGKLLGEFFTDTDDYDQQIKRLLGLNEKHD